MGNLISMNLLLGAVITILGMIFTRQLLSLSGAEGEILNYAERYLHIIFAGSLFVNFAQSANMIMRGVEHPVLYDNSSVGSRSGLPASRWNELRRKVPCRNPQSGPSGFDSLFQYETLITFP